MVPKRGDESAHRVHVPAARGSLTPEMDSMQEDLPALCDPMAAMVGRSMSTCTLYTTEAGCGGNVK